MAIVVVLVAIPIAGLAGSVVYTARDRRYAHEALSRHVLTQTVISPGPTVPASGTAAAASQPPQPAHRAVTDAAFVALAILLRTAIAMSCVLTATRWRADRARDAQWERELRCLQSDNGWRNQP